MKDRINTILVGSNASIVMKGKLYDLIVEQGARAMGSKGGQASAATRDPKHMEAMRKAKKDKQ